MTAPDPDDARPDPARPDTARPGGAAGPDGPAAGPDGVASGREPTRPDVRRPELPDDVDAAFAAIVADWAASGAPRWPGEGPAVDADGPSSGLGTAPGPGTDDRPAELDGPSPRRSISRPTDPPGGRAGSPPGTRRGPHVDPPPRRDGARAVPPRPDEDDHFVPPEPPPLPRLGLSSLLGLGLLVIGVVLLAVPGLLGGPVGLGIVPGLLAMTAGLGWLVFGLRRSREHGDGHGPDDGARL